MPQQPVRGGHMTYIVRYTRKARKEHGGEDDA